MPSEVRHLLFQPLEVVRAVTEYRRRVGLPLPVGLVDCCGPESEGEDGAVVFRMTFVSNPAPDRSPRATAKCEPQDVVVDAPALAAALILHCRDRRIPLPAGAEKSIRRIGDQICLVAKIGRAKT